MGIWFKYKQRNKVGVATDFGDLVAWWLVGNETDALDLTNVVKANDTNEAIGVCSPGLLKLLQDLRSISAAKHRQLPHGPVPSVIVSW